MSYQFKHTSFISENNEIRASLYLAENSTNWVVLSHGFTGDRIGPSYLFVFLARSLSEVGFNVISFDFSGCGESDGLFKDMTIEGLCKDLSNCVKYIKNNFTVNKLILLGHSLGGMLSSLMAAKLSAEGIILLSPVADIEKHVLGYSNVFTGESRGDGTYSIGSFLLKMEFLESFKQAKPVTELCNNFINPILLIQGDSDETIVKEESYLYINEGNKKSINIDYELIKNGDHCFSDIDQREFISKKIISWIKENVI